MQKINSPQRAITAQYVKSAEAGPIPLQKKPSQSSAWTQLNGETETRSGYQRHADLGYCRDWKTSLVTATTAQSKVIVHTLFNTLKQ